MNDDITRVLENWDYRLGRVDARRVKGEGGVEKLQLRIDLGLLQMNAQFRPDGKRPFGHPTLLDHFLVRLEKHRDKNGGEDDHFSINPDECAKLQQESHPVSPPQHLQLRAGGLRGRRARTPSTSSSCLTSCRTTP